MSMGMTAARHAREVVSNAETVVALEALGAAQALDLRTPLEPGPATRAVRQALRAAVPYFDEDREFGPDIAAAIALVRSGALTVAAETVLGPLAFRSKIRPSEHLRACSSIVVAECRCSAYTIWTAGELRNRAGCVARRSV